MNYLAVRFDVEAADGDRWSDALLDAGASSVDATDPRAGTADEAAVFAEPADADPAWWPVTRLTALCATDVDAASIMQSTATALGRTLPAFETLNVTGPAGTSTLAGEQPLSLSVIATVFVPGADAFSDPPPPQPATVTAAMASMAAPAAPLRRTSLDTWLPVGWMSQVVTSRAWPSGARRVRRRRSGQST